jgi:hypothetical protein
MSDYTTASRTKEHFSEQLISEHTEIVSIAPQLARDSNGMLTSEGVIVIGVRRINPKHDLTGQQSIAVRQEIPSELPAIDAGGFLSTTEMIPVIVEYEGVISSEMNTAGVRPCPGGFSISHSAPGETAGTLGGVVSVNGVWGFILSNNHVLARNNNAVVGDNIWQPGQADGGGPADIIATLQRWIPINFDGKTPNEVDCALAQASAPWNNSVAQNIQGIGTPTDIGEAKVDQAIRKSGRTTQLTTGKILSDNATFIRADGALFVNQLQYSRMTQGGDSGSFIFDNNSTTVLGLHFAGSNSASYGNKISRVLVLISKAFSAFSFDGKETKFDEIKVKLF